MTTAVEFWASLSTYIPPDRFHSLEAQDNARGFYLKAYRSLPIGLTFLVGRIMAHHWYGTAEGRLGGIFVPSQVEDNMTVLKAGTNGDSTRLGLFVPLSQGVDNTIDGKEMALVMLNSYLFVYLNNFE